MTAFIPVTILFAVILMIPVMIGVYVYRDANRRGMNAILWTLVAVFAPSLIGFIIYLLVRDSYSNLRCPTCDTPVKDSFVVCPQCGTKLRPSCPNCSAPVEPGWKLCPQCASPLPEIQADVHPPKAPKDKSIVKILAILIIIPALVIGLLIFSFSVQTSGGGATYRETTFDEYKEEMYSDIAYQNVQTWLNSLDKRLDHAYALRYDYGHENNVEHLYLIYVPNAGNQTSYGIGQSGSIFGSTLSLDIHATGDSGSFFNLISYSNKAPKLVITMDGKKIPCDVTVVDYNPTVFALVPEFDIPQPVATDNPIAP